MWKAPLPTAEPNAVSLSKCTQVYMKTGSRGSAPTAPDVSLRLSTHTHTHEKPRQDLKTSEKIEHKDRFAWVFPL